jgi:hypothetical protein
MSFSNAAETAILNQVFKATALPWNGNTNLWLALCTADPGETATGASMSEATYGSYARVAVVRATDLTVSGATVSNTNLVQFPLCTSGSNVITHCAIVDSASGAGNVLIKGVLNSSPTIATGVQPQFPAAGLVFTLD